MKILVFAPHFYPYKGGLEKYCLEISKRMAEKGHSVFVVTSRTDNFSKKTESLFNINIFRLESWHLVGGIFSIVKPAHSNKKIFNRLKIIKPDVVITNTRFFLLSYMGQRFAKKNHIPSIHIEHGTCHPQLKNHLLKFCAYIYDQIFGRATIRLASTNLAISKSARDFSIKLGAKSDVKIIYNSVDTDYFKPDHKKRSDTVIFIGRLIEGKGVQDLIAAFKQIHNDNILLKIIGEGDYKNKLVQLAERNKRVMFLGEKNEKEIKQILNDSSIFVNPSYSEGLPTSVLEAGAMGCAIIATDVGGTKEIIDNELNGLLIPIKQPGIIKERLQELIVNKTIRERYGNNINKKIESVFSWNNNIDKLLKQVTKYEKITKK